MFMKDKNYYDHVEREIKKKNFIILLFEEFVL